VARALRALGASAGGGGHIGSSGLSSSGLGGSGGGGGASGPGSGSSAGGSGDGGSGAGAPTANGVKRPELASLDGGPGSIGGASITERLAMLQQAAGGGGGLVRSLSSASTASQYLQQRHHGAGHHGAPPQHPGQPQPLLAGLDTDPAVPLPPLPPPPPPGAAARASGVVYNGSGAELPVSKVSVGQSLDLLESLADKRGAYDAASTIGSASVAGDSISIAGESDVFAMVRPEDLGDLETAVGGEWQGDWERGGWGTSGAGDPRRRWAWSPVSREGGTSFPAWCREDGRRRREESRRCHQRPRCGITGQRQPRPHAPYRPRPASPPPWTPPARDQPPARQRGAAGGAAERVAVAGVPPQRRDEERDRKGGRRRRRGRRARAAAGGGAAGTRQHQPGEGAGARAGRGAELWVAVGVSFCRCALGRCGETLGVNQHGGCEAATAGASAGAGAGAGAPLTPSSTWPCRRPQSELTRLLVNAKVELADCKGSAQRVLRSIRTLLADQDASAVSKLVDLEALLAVRFPWEAESSRAARLLHAAGAALGNLRRRGGGADGAVAAAVTTAAGGDGSKGGTMSPPAARSRSSFLSALRRGHAPAAPVSNPTSPMGGGTGSSYVRSPTAVAVQGQPG
jgi:hypothetical protein